MPNSNLFKPRLLYSRIIPFSTHVAHELNSPQHSPQPVTKSHSAPANDNPSTTTLSRHITADSTTVEALLVSTLETKLHVPSTPSPSSTSTKDGLLKKIIAALTVADEGNAEIDIRFSGVSEDDYDHVMSAIAEIDHFVRKPAYISNRSCFIASKLPSNMQTNFLPPMSKVIRSVIQSMPISAYWNLIFPIRMSSLLTIMGKRLGVPDLLLQMDGPRCSIPLWIMEISFSQSKDELMSSIQRYATNCKDAQIITIIDVCESQPHKKPQETSELAIRMMGQDLLTLDEWLAESDDPAFGSVLSSVPHQWVSPLTIMVKTWLRHPDGKFYLKETDNDSYYACAEICPKRDSAEILHLNSVFQDGMKLIRDKIISYVQDHCSSEPEDIDAMRQWNPSDTVFDWDQVMTHVRMGASRDGFDRYCDWHRKLKRRADEPIERPPQESCIKRLRKGQ